VASMQTPARRFANPYISNFAEVAPGVLYRGAQPEIPKGIEFLGAASPFSFAPPIKTVIDLQGAQDEAESRSCYSYGINYFNPVLPGLEILTTPPTDKINDIMGLLDKSFLYPIFVHCLHGSDRTGCIIALWRVTHDAWSVADAIEEMRAFGNSWIEIGYRREIEKYLKEHAQSA
jgi:protein tyrosine/serine phosphatase